MNRPDGVGIFRLHTDGLGNAKIRYFHFSVHGNNNILRLNIPMDNMTLMSSHHALGNLNGNSDCLFIVQAPFFGLSLIHI